MSLRDEIYSLTPDGKMVEVRNWMYRRDADDTLIAIPLAEDLRRRVEARRAEGADDREIFDELHPEREEDLEVANEIAIDLEDLTGEQLVALVRRLLCEELPSLDRMERADLAALARRLLRDLQVKVVVDPR